MTGPEHMTMYMYLSQACRVSGMAAKPDVYVYVYGGEIAVEISSSSLQFRHTEHPTDPATQTQQSHSPYLCNQTTPLPTSYSKYFTNCV